MDGNQKIFWISDGGKIMKKTDIEKRNLDPERIRKIGMAIIREGAKDNINTEYVLEKCDMIQDFIKRIKWNNQ